MLAGGNLVGTGNLKISGRSDVFAVDENPGAPRVHFGLQASSIGCSTGQREKYQAR
jgi:hypothetical protein